MKDRDPGLASVFSFLVPGLGQIYMGRTGWGVFHFFFQIGLIIIGIAVAFPLISTESGLPFSDRLVDWLENPLNMGLSFGVIFLLLANWIWSFMSASPKEHETDIRAKRQEDDIAQLVKTARMDYLKDTQEQAFSEAAPTREAISPFAQTLYELLELKDMTVKELSSITGLSLQELTRYLQGAQPDDATINIIARGLNVSPRVLLSETLR